MQCVQSKLQPTIKDIRLSPQVHNTRLDASVITRLVCLSAASRECIFAQEKDPDRWGALKFWAFIFLYHFLWMTSAVPNSPFSTWGKEEGGREHCMPAVCCAMLFARKPSGCPPATCKQTAGLLKCSSQSEQCTQYVQSRIQTRCETGLAKHGNAKLQRHAWAVKKTQYA